MRLYCTDVVQRLRMIDHQDDWCIGWCTWGLSRIDYCNCLLAGAPQYQLNKLQAVMNSAGRQHLWTEWLWLHQSCAVLSASLVACWTEDTIQTLSAGLQGWMWFCTAVPCRLLSASVSGRSGLPSSTRGDLVVIRTETDSRQRSFAVSAPLAWNRLPEKIRNLQSLQLFNSSLKTHLFSCTAWHRQAGHWHWYSDCGHFAPL